MPNQELLLIHGPTPVVDEIQEALGRETWAHTDPRFVEIFSRSLELSRKLFNNPEGEVFVVAGSGTLAMETALVNTVAAGERILVLSQGYFGDRFLKLADSFGIETDCVKSEWGKRVDPAEVSRKLNEHRYKAVTITHVDTSTGVLADLETLVPLVKGTGTLLILDGVCATAAVEEDMSRNYRREGWNIDLVLTGGQKAIGVPPGLAILSFGPSALAARRELGRIPAYYADIDNWIPVMHDPKKYFATPAVNMIYAYHRAMEMIFEEGLETRYRRHEGFGKSIRAALRALGLEPLAEESVASPTTTCFLYLGKIEDIPFRKRLTERQLVVAGALGNLAGRGFRLGHMGNVRAEQLKEAVRLIGETLLELGHPVDPEQAVTEFERALL